MDTTLSLVYEGRVSERPTKRLRKKQSIGGVSRNFHTAWSSYIRGNVVSDHSARIIKNFLLAVLAEGRHHDKIDEMHDTKEEEERSVLGNLTIDKIHQILNAQLKLDKDAKDSDNTEKGSRRLINAMEKTASFWQLPKDVKGQCRLLAKDYCKTMPTESSAPIAARKESTKKSAVLYKGSWKSRYKQWRTEVSSSEKPPYDEQWRCLDSIHRRCELEYNEERIGFINMTDEDPFCNLLHGPPGTGKSRLIMWIRSYFEKVWDWEHGVQFVILAPMNTMANNVGGETMHSWGEIPFARDDGKVNTRNQSAAVDLSSMCLKCEALRFLIIDEIENAGADALAVLEMHVTSAANKKLYPFRPKVRGAMRPRLFGGVNTLVCGDWWQLPPVRQVSLCSNPLKAPSSMSQKMLDIFWSRGRNTIQQLFELVTSGSQLSYKSAVMGP